MPEVVGPMEWEEQEGGLVWHAGRGMPQRASCRGNEPPWTCDQIVLSAKLPNGRAYRSPLVATVLQNPDALHGDAGVQEEPLDLTASGHRAANTPHGVRLGQIPRSETCQPGGPRQHFYLNPSSSSIQRSLPKRYTLLFFRIKMRAARGSRGAGLTLDLLVHEVCTSSCWSYKYQISFCI